MERGEQLSALMDGELDELATARLLRALEQDARALDTWEHYALIGDALRERDGPGSAGRLGAQRALARIAEEAAPRRSWQARLPALRPAVPWALAASAALVAFLMANPDNNLLSKLLPSPVAGNTTSTPMQARLEGMGTSEQMARYIDYHREVAGAGLERTAFALAGGGGGQGR